MAPSDPLTLRQRRILSVFDRFRWDSDEDVDAILKAAIDRGTHLLCERLKTFDCVEPEHIEGIRRDLASKTVTEFLNMGKEAPTSPAEPPALELASA